MKFVLIVLIVVIIAVSFAQVDEDAQDVIFDTKSAPVVGDTSATTPIINVKKSESTDFVSEIETPNDSISEEEFRKWPVKKLKSFLAEKGLKCKGCSERDDYVQMALKNQHVSPAPNDQQETTKEEKLPDIDKDELEEMMAKLRRNGFGGSRMFSAADLNGLSPEELAEKINGKPPKSKKKSKDSKSDNSKADDSKQKSKKNKKSEKKESTKKNSKEGKKSNDNKSSSRKRFEEAAEEETIEL
mmetsp:Transcript_10478/g.7818  ORF Transcript_10478/g.7818 Transcript_10478/m.7818 type:complete len:243 (+) Transcript_10478:2-730(+)